MVSYLARHWYLLFLRGLAAVAFGILAIPWPAITLEVLVVIFGAYALLDGVFAVAAAVTGNDRHAQRWALLLEGFIGVAAGIIIFKWPQLSIYMFVFLIAAWSIVTGIFEIVVAIQLRREIQGEWLLALAGIVSVLFGVFIAGQPIVGVVAVAWMIGLYASGFGILLILLSLRLRTLGRHLEVGGPTAR